MDEFQNNDAKWKKPDKKEYMLYDFIYVKPRKYHSVMTESVSVIARGGFLACGREWEGR